jgi:hypothetical protein
VEIGVNERASGDVIACRPLDCIGRLEPVFDDFQSTSIDANELISNRKDGGNGERKSYSLSVSGETTCADCDNTRFAFSNDTLVPVSPESLSLRPKCTANSKMNLPYRLRRNVSAPIDGSYFWYSIIVKLAAIRRYRFDPDTSASVDDTYIGMASFARPILCQQQSFAGVEECAANEHLPEAGIWVACKCLHEAAVSIG